MPIRQARPAGAYKTKIKHSRIPPEAGGRAQQVGQTNSAIYAGKFHYNYYLPRYSKLREYEQAVNVDPTIQAGLEFIIKSLISSLGEYQHPDLEIQRFVRANLRMMSSNLRQVLGEILFSNLWAGYSVSEFNWTIVDGQVWLESVVSLHPATIIFVTNDQGRLTQGEKVTYPTVIPNVTTGIWQYQAYKASPVNIPLNKVIYTTHSKRYSNYYGVSALESIYPHYLQKTLLYPSMVNALERFASPILYAIVPRTKSSRSIEDPADGGIRYRTLAEETEEALANIHDSNGIVLEDPGEPFRAPEIATLTAQNNFGDIYTEAIKHHDKQIYRGLLLPAQLIDDSVSAFSQTSLEVQFEQFKQHLLALYAEVVEPFTEMCLGKLVWLNFGSLEPGYIPMRMTDPITRRLQTELYTAMIDRGIIDVTLPKDLQNVRDMIGDLPILNNEELKQVSQSAASMRASAAAIAEAKLIALQSELKQQRIVTRQHQLFAENRIKENRINTQLKLLQQKYFESKHPKEPDGETLLKELEYESGLDED
jgi:hypothetical protein